MGGGFGHAEQRATAGMRNRVEIRATLQRYRDPDGHRENRKGFT